ncbi:MAG: peptidyl-tRNA hydrolase [DPANN group archaeon]|nr:peptidyl-tRNA hydrolase [DPANN group archaeon]
MKYKQAIVLRVDVGMSRGKLAAQAAHASLEAALKAMQRDKSFSTKIFESWRKEGAKKVVLKVESEQALLRLRDLAIRASLANSMIRDAGLTEVPAGTVTALAIGPDEEKKIDKITKDLNAL